MKRTLSLIFDKTVAYVFENNIYCISKKSLPNLLSNLLYKMSQDFLDRQYLEGFIDHAKALEVETNKARLNRFDFFYVQTCKLI